MWKLPEEEVITCMTVLVDTETGEYLGWGESGTIGDILADFAGRPVIALTPETDGVLEGYVAHVDGEDCWSGIKYGPETGKFQVDLCSDSNGDLDPVYTFENYFDALRKAKELVG